MADDDLSEYERDRLVSIAENEEVMRALGLTKLIEKSPAPKKQKVSIEPQMPTRASARVAARQEAADARLVQLVMKKKLHAAWVTFYDAWLRFTYGPQQSLNGCVRCERVRRWRGGWVCPTPAAIMSLGRWSTWAGRTIWQDLIN